MHIWFDISLGDKTWARKRSHILSITSGFSDFCCKFLWRQIFEGLCWKYYKCKFQKICNIPGYKIYIPFACFLQQHGAVVPIYAWIIKIIATNQLFLTFPSKSVEFKISTEIVHKQFNSNYYHILIQRRQRS